jgi:DNA-binding MarR family transcriptional regulator
MPTCANCGHTWRVGKAGLTAAEDKIVRYLQQTMNGSNVSPSLRQIGKGTGMEVSSVFRVVGQLVAKGWLTRAPYACRGLRLTDGR